MKKDFSISDCPKNYQKFFLKENKIIHQFLKGSKNVLDVGCGNGRLVSVVAPIVKNYYGIDIDKQEIIKAKRLKNKYDILHTLKCAVSVM